MSEPTPKSPHRAPEAALRALRERLDQGRPGPLPALRHAEPLRQSLARLRLDEQVRVAMTLAPSQAGPINSQALVTRALAQLRALSPAYLQRFMAVVDGLAWMEGAQAQPDSARSGPPVARARTPATKPSGTPPSTRSASSGRARKRP